MREYEENPWDEVDWDDIEATDLVHPFDLNNPPSKKRKKYYTQYTVEEGAKHRPTPRTEQILPAGLYTSQRDQYGIFFDRQEISNEELIRFPDTVADKIISEFHNFWKKKQEYQERGENHKRGFLLWGPPGGGKTCLVSLITQQFVNDGNLVLNFTSGILEGIETLRTIEPDRKIMIVIEDIDGLIKYTEIEQELLQFLDGSIPHVNTIMIATTNYPEQLPDRIINRPSRFDRVEFIGFPTRDERLLYLKRKARIIKDSEYDKWLDDTEDFTFAHLKELIVSTEVFGLEYDETLKRINRMRKKLADSSRYQSELHGDSKKMGDYVL